MLRATALFTLITFSCGYPTDKDIESSGNFGGILPVSYGLTLQFFGPFGETLPTERAHFSGNMTMKFVTVEGNVSAIYLHQEDLYIYSARLYNGTEYFDLRTNASSENMIRFNLPLTLLKNREYSIRVLYSGRLHRERGPFFRYAAVPGNNSAAYWSISTLFQMRSARKAFPCVDHPMMKATFQLCLSYNGHRGGTKITLLSNTKSDADFGDDRYATTCFEETLRMSTYVFSFAVLHNYREILSNSGFPIHVHYSYPEDRPFAMAVIEKSQRLITELEDYFLMKFPLDRLTFIIHHQMPQTIHGIENFGLISLSGRFKDYDDHDGNRILTHEILHQWIGNVMTVKSWSESCVQEGLTTYLDFVFSNKTFGTSLDRSFEQARQWMTDEAIQPELIFDYKNLNQVVSYCFNKPPMIFSTIAEMLGPENFRKYVRRILKKFKYQNLGFEDYRANLEQLPSTTAKTFEMFFTKRGFPVFNVTILPSQKFLEVSVDQYLVPPEGPLTEKRFIGDLPLIFHCEDGKRPTTTAIDYPATFGLERNKNDSWVILDPSATYYKVIYDMENYRRVANCLASASRGYGGRVCPDKRLVMTMREDLLWAAVNRGLVDRTDEMREIIGLLNVDV